MERTRWSHKPGIEGTQKQKSKGESEREYKGFEERTIPAKVEDLMDCLIQRNSQLG